VAVNFADGEPCFSCTLLSICDPCTIASLSSALAMGFVVVEGGLWLLGRGAFAGELFGAIALGDAFRTDAEAALDAVTDFVAVVDFAATGFTATAFTVALVDFALVVVVLMLSTSMGSTITFFGLPLFLATTSADILRKIVIALSSFGVRSKC